MARMVEAASTTAKSTRLFTAMFTACCNIGGFFTSSSSGRMLGGSCESCRGLARSQTLGVQ